MAKGYFQQIAVPVPSGIAPLLPSRRYPQRVGEERPAARAAPIASAGPRKPIVPSPVETPAPLRVSLSGSVRASRDAEPASVRQEADTAMAPPAEPLLPSVSAVEVPSEIQFAREARHAERPLPSPLVGPQPGVPASLAPNRTIPTDASPVPPNRTRPTFERPRAAISPQAPPDRVRPEPPAPVVAFPVPEPEAPRLPLDLAAEATLQVRPVVTPRFAAPQPPRPTAESTSRLQLKIGNIEVRVTPPAPATRAEPAAKAPAVALSRDFASRFGFRQG